MPALPQHHQIKLEQTCGSGPGIRRVLVRFRVSSCVSRRRLALGRAVPIGSSRRCPACSEDRLVPWVELGWRPWGLGVRCRAAPGETPGLCPRVAGRALPGSAAAGRPRGRAPASPGCWRCCTSLGVPGTAAALEQGGALAPEQGRRRSTAWQPWDLDALCQGWGGDAEGTGTAPLCTSPGSRGGGGASPSCTGGHAVPGRGTGTRRSSGVAVLSAGAQLTWGLEREAEARGLRGAPCTPCSPATGSRGSQGWPAAAEALRVPRVGRGRGSRASPASPWAAAKSWNQTAPAEAGTKPRVKYKQQEGRRTAPPLTTTRVARPWERLPVIPGVVYSVHQ